MNISTEELPAPLTPAPVSQLVRFRPWVLGLGLLLLLWFLVQVKSILLPFVVGMLSAYFLDPAVRKLRNHGWSRGLSAGLITVGFFALSIGLCILLVPPAIHQLLALLQHLPDYANQLQQRYGNQLQRYMSKLGADQVDAVKDSMGTYTSGVVAWVGGVATGALHSGLALLDLFSLLFVTPIVAFYLLRDWHMVVARFYALLPRDYSHTIREQLNEIDITLSGFIRGQTNICLIMASYYGILLSLVGLNFGLLIGVLSGLVLFIPFVGFLSSFIVTVIVTLLQFPDGARLVAVLIIFGIGAVLENSVLTPRLVGRNVGLHPLWIIFGMLSGGALFGFVGILISVPVTAVIGVLARFAIARYLHSSLYRGEPQTPNP